MDLVDIVFDATTAYAHKQHSEVLTAAGKKVIDLTPAAIGPFTVPSVNLTQHFDAPNVNMVTCGGQATIPIVHAINRVVQLIMLKLSQRSQVKVQVQEHVQILMNLRIQHHAQLKK